ncbi:MAG: hypothetical protein KDE27_03460, partial [Planctomycetes bacterium]|nr:hypothetical protein [Planctomycetota bacterium]
MSDQAFAPLAYGALRGGVAALALWALLVHGAWTLTGAVDAWWLPVFVAAGGALGSRLARRRGVASEPSAPAPRWLLWTTAAIVLLSFAALALGAIATPARHWDGVVAWELKANAIAAAPDLSHPLFADP